MKLRVQFVTSLATPYVKNVLNKLVASLARRSVKKSTPRSKPSTPSSTSNINLGPKTPQQGWGDDVIDDVGDVSKELFKDGDEGEGSVTPSRRRTKGRKSIIQNTREKVKDECTVS